MTPVSSKLPAPGGVRWFAFRTDVLEVKPLYQLGEIEFTMEVKGVVLEKLCLFGSVKRAWLVLSEKLSDERGIKSCGSNKIIRFFI